MLFLHNDLKVLTVVGTWPLAITQSKDVICPFCRSETRSWQHFSVSSFQIWSGDFRSHNIMLSSKNIEQTRLKRFPGGATYSGLRDYLRQRWYHHRPLEQLVWYGYLGAPLSSIQSYLRPLPLRHLRGRSSVCVRMARCAFFEGRTEFAISKAPNSKISSVHKCVLANSSMLDNSSDFKINWQPKHTQGTLHDQVKPPAKTAKQKCSSIVQALFAISMISSSDTNYKFSRFECLQIYSLEYQRTKFCAAKYVPSKIMNKILAIWKR